MIENFEFKGGYVGEGKLLVAKATTSGTVRFLMMKDGEHHYTHILPDDARALHQLLGRMLDESKTT